MAENILNGGVEVCREIRRNLEALATAKSTAEAAGAAAAQGEKSLKAKEKAVKDEIASTTKKRKDELEASYDSEIATLKQRNKAVKDEKEKDRGEQQAKRIEDETAVNREKDRELELEIRSIYKRDGVSTIFNTKLFYALFMPRTITEWLVLICAILLTLVLLPTFIYFVLIPEASKSVLIAMAIYYACLFVFIGLYIVISHITKGKHRETFFEVLKIRREIRSNRKDIKSISRHVQRDKDDSKYDLGAYDAEMERISGEVDVITEKKKAALKEFESNTKQVISDQITANNAAELDELKKFVEERETEKKEATEKAKELSLFVTTNYEPFIGKADLNIETIDKLILAFENGKASNISEALSYIKQPAVSESAAVEASETDNSSSGAEVSADNKAAQEEEIDPFFTQAAAPYENAMTEITPESDTKNE